MEFFPLLSSHSNLTRVTASLIKLCIHTSTIQVLLDKINPNSTFWTLKQSRFYILNLEKLDKIYFLVSSNKAFLVKVQKWPLILISTSMTVL